MNEFNLEKYIVRHIKTKGTFKLQGVPADLQTQLINEFVFIMPYQGVTYRVNVHANNKNEMILQDYNINVVHTKK